MQPPPIDDLGNSSGFTFRLQDRGADGLRRADARADQLLGSGEQEPDPAGRPCRRPGAARRKSSCVIDREKAAALGVTFEDINSTLSTKLGSAYVNDFPNRGRMQRVIVQADNAGRMQPDDILTLQRAQQQGQPVPLSSFATTRWITGPTQTVGFNYYPSMSISGSAKPGYTSGDAMAEMERLAGQLPRGFGYEWTGQSRRRSSPARRRRCCSALSLLVVFLCLAALYESWTIPLVGAAGGAARRARRGARRDAARHAERRLLQGRPDHHHRPGGEERDPDHRVRQGPARPGQGR